MCFWYIFQFGRLTPRCDFDCFRLDWYTSLCAYLVSHQPSQFSYSPQSHPASQEYHVIHMECSLSGPEIGSFSTYLESYGRCESIYFDQHKWYGGMILRYISTQHIYIPICELHIHIIHGCEVMFDPDWNAQLHRSLLQTHPKLWSQGQRYRLDNGINWRNVNCLVWDRQNKWTVLSTHV